MGYLHGIEIKEGAKRTVIATGDTSVIALIGTAPQGCVGEVKLITSKDAGRKEFGEDVAGFTIPAALDVIFSMAGAKVLVLNVLSAEKAAALLEDDGRMTRSEAGELATNIYKASLRTASEATA